MLRSRRSPFPFFVSLLAFALTLAFARAGSALPSAEQNQIEARRLYARAAGRLERRTVEMRRMAITDLERAALLDPKNAEYQLTLARTYYLAGFVKQAMRRFELVASIAPSDPESRYGLGQVWRRDYLKYLEKRSLDRAIGHLESAARLEPRHTDSWLMLSSLLIERGDLPGANAAAEHALEAESGRAEALLALGSTRWRLGQVEDADSAFRAALPRLKQSVRDRLEDIAPVASERDTTIYRRLDGAAQIEFVRRFWTEHDPDLATSENEAQLEYWARVAQAYFLFYEPRRREWDERGEVYVRYGPPEKADYNPVGASLVSQVGRGSRFTYPANVLVWDYPRLGMKVTLQDRVLSEYYQLPVAYDHDPDPRPDADSLAKLPVVGTHGMRGVFPMLPPGARRLPVEGQVAHFEGDHRPRLFAALVAPGSSTDSLWGEFVVLDSTERVVAREKRALPPSACEADRFRAAEFTRQLPPGDYRVGLSVRASAGRRGSIRMSVSLAVVDSADLALSDVVVTCGTPFASSTSVRLEPNPSARIGPGMPLTAYFEITHLALAANGTSRFEYQYSVKSAEKDRRVWIQRTLDPRRSPPALSASRSDENTGSIRRQFVSVPVQELPPGKYLLEVRVRDLLADAEAVRTVPFSRTATNP
ncbi:MAG: GWxTD domain-containing protein [Candidatus Eisenbacteria bacterium]